MSRTGARLSLLGLLARQSLRDLGRRGPSASPRRILIVHHLLLGDTLMLAALLAKLRQQHPQAEILMCCPRPIVPLYARQPWGVQAVAFDPRDAASLRALHALARSGDGFDLAVVPAENRLTWLARALGARHVVAYAGDRPAHKNWGADLLRPWPDTPTPLPETFASLVDGPPPPPYAPTQWPMEEGAPFVRPATPYAVLHLGASSRLKLWPPARWTALADWLQAQGITPVWSAGAKETALVAEVDPAGRYTSYAGQLDLLQMAALLRGARLLVSPDTGIAHLGRVTATPSVTLYGPGSALLCGSSPFFAASPARAISAEIACRDQTILFRREVPWVQRCGRGFGAAPHQCAEARCMAALSPDAVQEACLALLREAAHDANLPHPVTGAAT